MREQVVPPTLQRLASQLSLGVVAVVGAGMSIDARYPTTAGLTALLWDAIDSDPIERAALAVRLNRADGRAKTLIGDDQNRQAYAWEMIRQSKKARARLQASFHRLDAERSTQPSPVHEALAVLLHTRVVECVISLNWDTALECTYERRYGVSLPQEWLLKPHGDAASPGEDWVLPYEAGLVTPDVRDEIAKFVADHPRLLLVVGYSERDEAVVSDLIAPLDDAWPVVRVRPSASGQNDIRADAEIALQYLASPYQLREATAPWRCITFARQRDISAALAGERLGPRDIEACPRLPEVQYVVDALHDRHAVVLNGESGSGKSISAYQALRKLAKEGFEILRLRDTARDLTVSELMVKLGAFPNRRVLFIDDAQDLSPDATRELADLASADQRVLIVGIDHISSGVTNIRISNRAAIGAFAHDMRRRANEILPRISVLDDQVGAGVGYQCLNDRIEEASQAAEYAWHFFFVLSGGWRRTEKILLELREINRADLALVALAVAQISSTDTAVSREKLMEFAESIGRSHAWIDDCLQILIDRRLVLEDDDLYRCVHMRAAWSVMKWMLHPPHFNYTATVQPTVPPIASAPRAVTPKVPMAKRRSPTPAHLLKAQADEDRKSAVLMMNCALDSPSISLRGIAWLVGRNHFSETRWVMKYHGVLTDDRVRKLATRALKSPGGAQAGIAAQLLGELMISCEDLVLEIVMASSDRLLEWVVMLIPENVWGIGDLFNGLTNRDKEFTTSLLEHADAKIIADLIPTGGWPNVYATAHAVERLTQAGGMPLISRVAKLYDHKAFHELFSDLPAEIPRINEVFKTLAYSDPELGLELFDVIAVDLAERVSFDPIPLSQQLFDTFFWLLGYAPKFLRGKHSPNAERRRLARKFIRALDITKLTGAIEQPDEENNRYNFPDFINFIWEVDPITMRKIVNAIDLNNFEESTAGRLREPSRELLYIYYLLESHRPGDGRAILDRHEEVFTTLDLVLAMIAPGLAIRLLLKGLPLNLGLEHHDWASSSTILQTIAQDNEQVARELAWANKGPFIHALSGNHSDRFEGLTQWVAICDVHASGLVDTVLSELPSGAVASWAKELRIPARRREIAPLVVRARDLSGNTADEARNLCQRFPSIAS